MLWNQFQPNMEHIIAKERKLIRCIQMNKQAPFELESSENMVECLKNIFENLSTRKAYIEADLHNGGSDVFMQIMIPRFRVGPQWMTSCSKFWNVMEF